MSKAVEMLLERVMIRMETLSFPGRMLPINNVESAENGHEVPDDRIRLEHATDKSKCNC